MKKFIIIEICVVIALALGIFIGRITSPFNDYTNYYKNADKAWTKAWQLDNPPITLDDTDTDRLNKVRAAYRAVFENYPDSLWADDALYQLASRLPRTDEEAFALLRRLIRDYPDSEYADDSMYAIAITTYRIAEELQQTGTLESLTAYYDRALALFNQLIATYPGSVLQVEAQINAAMCYYGRGDASIALSQLENLRIELGNNPKIYQILFFLGNIYLAQQDYENARIELTNVIDSGDPEYGPRASFLIAQTYFREGKFEEAVKRYQNVIDLYSDMKVGQDAHFYIGWAYHLNKEHDEAIARLEEAIEIYPNNAIATTAKFYIGQIAEDKEDTALAIEVYQRFADDTTHNYDSRLQAQYKVGKIYEQIGDLERAIEVYDKFLVDYPEPHQNSKHPSREITESYVQKLKVEQLDGDN